MKIALPTRDGKIDDHFGHCDHFTVATVTNGVVEAKERVESPVGCGCKSDIAPRLAEMGVRILLGGNMGDGARNVLNSNGIQVFRGCTGNVDDVINAYIAGKIEDVQIACNHEDCDHHHDA